VEIIPLNWSTGVYIDFIALIPAIILVIIVLKQYFKKKYLHYFILTQISLFMALFIIFNALSYLFLSPNLFRICVYVLDADVFFAIILVDLIRSESIDPIKISIASVLITASVFFSLDPNAIIVDYFPNGELGVFQSGILPIVNTFVYLYAGGLAIFYTAKIFWNTPEKLKVFSGLYLLGMLIIGIGGVITFALRLPLVIPAIHSVIYATMAIVTAIPLTFKPELAFILPFKATKLTIMETKGGIPIFSYSWSKRHPFIEEDLYTGILHGFGLVLNEALQKGNIREIHLDNAILITRRSEQYPIVCVLVATKSTRTLRYALNSFMERFCSEYSQYFEKLSNIDPFQSASNLVNDRFSFIPVYD